MSLSDQSTKTELKRIQQETLELEAQKRQKQLQREARKKERQAKKQRQLLEKLVAPLLFFLTVLVAWLANWLFHQ